MKKSAKHLKLPIRKAARGQTLPKRERLLRRCLCVEESIEDGIEANAVAPVLHDHGGDRLRDIGAPLQSDRGNCASNVDGLCRGSGKTLSAEHPEQLIEHSEDGRVAARPFGNAADGQVAAGPFGRAADGQGAVAGADVSAKSVRTVDSRRVS